MRNAAAKNIPAPALRAATVGVALGQNSEIITEAAGAVGQEIVDLLAVVNALSAAVPPKTLTGF